MSFKIRPSDLEGGKFIEVISADYGKSVCLKVDENNNYHLIKFSSVSISIIAKALADYLANENVAVDKIFVGNEDDKIFVEEKIFHTPEDRQYSQILKQLKEFLKENI